MTDDFDWDLVSYIVSSRYRLETARALVDGPRTPTKIDSEVEIGKLSHVSRALGELAEEGVAELKVSEDVQKGRFYGLTDEGKAALEAVSKHHEV